MLDFIPPEILASLVTAFRYIYLSSPIWLPIVFLIMLFNAWVDYRRSLYWQSLGSLLLELKLPREILKSPLAMEMVLNTFHQTADESNWYFKYWKGQTRSWFSLEIASIGGDVRFFVWTRKKYRNSIEVSFYSQYPGIEIHEVDDYTKNVYYDPKRHKMYACQWQLSEPDPYPIKTYVDYGLDKDPKEEFKIDPMTTLIEFLGTVPAGQNVWFQIIIRAHKKEKKKPLPWAKKIEKFAWSEDVDDWKEEAKKQVQDIIKKLKVDKEEGGYPRIPTKGEAETIAALERSISKIPFDVGIRSIYIADKDEYNGAYLGGMLGGFKQYNYPGLNGFKTEGWSGSFSYPWSSWFVDTDRLNRLVIDEYKLRRFFFSPWIGKYFYSKPFVLNAEELATIFHLPGAVSSTPTFERVPSKKSQPPSNLPI